MGVRAKRDGHALLKRELEDFAAGINLAAILPQTGGVEFDGAAGFFGGSQKPFVKRRATCRAGASGGGWVARWPVAEFLRQSAWPMISNNFDSAAIVSRSK